MKKSESLRAGEGFRRTLLEGERIEAKFLRCYYRIVEDEGPPIRVGFAVPSRSFNAVRRNRVKRLLREAVTREKKVVEEALNTAQIRATAVILFRGSKSHPVARMKLQTLQPHVAALCRSLAAKLRSVQ